MTRGLATLAASYTGTVDVDSAGRQLSVPALRQVGVPGPGLVTSLVPLDYRADNPWDRRYLGDSIELGEELQARSQGFTNQLGPGEGSRMPLVWRPLSPAAIDLVRRWIAAGANRLVD